MAAEQHMTDQFENANCEGLKQSIKEYLSIIEKYKDVEGSFISGTAYHMDKMISHLRLFQIEKNMGKNDEANKQMKLACEECSARMWEDCSEEKLFEYINLLNERNPITCLGNNEN